MPASWLPCLGLTTSYLPLCPHPTTPSITTSPHLLPFLPHTSPPPGSTSLPFPSQASPGSLHSQQAGWADVDIPLPTLPYLYTYSYCAAVTNDRRPHPVQQQTDTPTLTAPTPTWQSPSLPPSMYFAQQTCALPPSQTVVFLYMPYACCVPVPFDHYLPAVLCAFLVRWKQN